MRSWEEKIIALHETPGMDMATCSLIQLVDELHVLACQQQEEIKELRKMLLGHERRIADLGKNISRLSGVHGA